MSIPKILIVGQNPGKPHPVRKTDTHERLAVWRNHLGIEQFSFTNVVLTPGQVKEHQIDWRSFHERVLGYDKYLALGNFASSALKKLRIEHFKLPHPSGRNRLLNDPKYEKKMLRRCKRYLGQS